MTECAPYALVTAPAASEAVDVFLRREDADVALAAALNDEPEWVEDFNVAEIGLEVSAN